MTNTYIKKDGTNGNFSSADIDQDITPGFNFRSYNFISDLSLTDANLTDANFNGCILQNVNLSGANLTGANLRNVSFQNVNLTNTTLTGILINSGSSLYDVSFNFREPIILNPNSTQTSDLPIGYYYINDGVDKKLIWTFPTDITLTSFSFNENIPFGSEVATIGSTDSDSTSFTYSLVSGVGDTDNDKFQITGDKLKINVVPDYETKSSYNIRIKTQDESNNSYEKAFTLGVVDIPDTPTDITLTSFSFNENIPFGSEVATINTVDQDSTSFTYSLVSGVGDTDNDKFQITGDKLKIKESPNFEVQNSYKVRIKSSDDTDNSYEKTFTLSVIDNLEFFENPYNLISPSLSQVQEDTIQSEIDNTSITENFLETVGIQTNNTILGDINSILNLYVFSDTGSISKIPLIPNIQNTYFDKAINDKPTSVQSTDISLSSLYFKEYIPVETTVATLNTENLGGSTFVYSFASGSGDTHNNSFTISGSELKINAIPDYDTQNNYSIRIKSVEPRNCNISPFEKSFSLTVVSEPTDIKLSDISFCENIDCRSIVATISTVDKDSTTFIYSLVSGLGDDDNSKFVIEGDKLLIKESPNFEVQASYKVRIKSEDEKGNHYSKSFVLTVNDKLEFFETPYRLVQINLSEEQTNSITNIIDSTEVTNFLDTIGVQTNNTILGEINSILNLYVFSDTRKTSPIPSIPNLQNIYLDKYVTEVPNNSLSNINHSVKMNIENIDNIEEPELDKISHVYSKLRSDVGKETANKLQSLKKGNKENIKVNFKNFFTQLKLIDNYTAKPRNEKRVIFKQAIKNSMRVAKKECERKFKIDKEELLETVDIPQKVKERIDANGQEFTVIDKSVDENDIIMIFDEDNLGNFYVDIEDIGDLTVIKFFGTKVKIEKTSEFENTVSILGVDEGSTQAEILDGNIVSETNNPTIKSGKWELPLFYGSVGGGTGEEQPEEETQQSGDICFPSGTPVETDQGEIAIEKLTSENTIDGVNVVAVVPVYNECDYLVKIKKHALGPNYPKKTTLISRNHRVYLNKKREETIPALALYNGKTVTVVQREEHETIYNVLLPTHSKMTINGLVVETLHPKSVYARKI